MASGNLVAANGNNAVVDKPRKTLDDLVRHVNRYREEAFHFVREGLSHAAVHVHGPETEHHHCVYQYLAMEVIEWPELVARLKAGELPPQVSQAIEAAGGCDELDRHITGRELCWGLRDFALKRYGMLARNVLESWNVRLTSDFGRIVFGFIECDMMQKQSGDSEADFKDVYVFDEAFSNDAPPQDDGKSGRDS